MQANSRIHCSPVINKRKAKAHQVQRSITQIEVINESLQLLSSPSLTKQRLDGIKLCSVHTPRVNAKERMLFELKGNTDKRINRYKLKLNQ